MKKAFHHIGAFAVLVGGAWMAWHLSRTLEEVAMVRTMYFLSALGVVGGVYRLVAPETEDT